MIVYSVTLSLEREIEDSWLAWMQQEHIPEVMQTGFFSHYRFHKILEPVVDPDRVSYNVLYDLVSPSALDTYRREAAAALQEKHQQRFGEQVIAIRSVLKQLHSQSHA